MFYVYFHLRLDTGEIFYVGKGQKRRAWSKKSRNKWWHNVVSKAGYYIKIWRIFDTHLEALQEEEQMIKKCKDSGVVLTNLTSGGESGLLSEESKRKISLANLGKPKSLEERIRMSKFRQGRRPSPHTINQMSMTRKGMSQPIRKFNPKLSEADVLSISLDRRLSIEIQNEYGCSQGTVSRIRTGKKLK